MARPFSGARVERRKIEKNGRPMWRIRTVYPDKIVKNRHFEIGDPKVDEYQKKKERELDQLDEVTWERAINLWRSERLADPNLEKETVNETDRRLREYFRPVLSSRVAAITYKRYKELYHGRWDADRLLEHGLRNRPTMRRRGNPATWKACKLPCRCPGEGPPLAPDSHRNYLLEVGTFIRKCCLEKGFLREDPSKDSKSGNGVQGHGERNHGGLGKNRLGRKELRALYRTAVLMATTEGDERAVAVLFLLLFGFRSFEVTSRQCRFIDEETWTIEVDPDAAKTDASDRDNEIPQVLRPIVLRMLKGKRGEQYFFGDGDKPFDKDWLRDGLHAVCDRAKIKRVHPHSLRGAHEDLCKRAGKTAEEIDRQLGHSDKKVGGRSYTSEMGRRGARRAKQRIVLDVLEGGKSAAGGDT
jgi:hypothetical protein